MHNSRGVHFAYFFFLLLSQSFAIAMDVIGSKSLKLQCTFKVHFILLEKKKKEEKQGLRKLKKKINNRIITS